MGRNWAGSAVFSFVVGALFCLVSVTGGYGQEESQESIDDLFNENISEADESTEEAAPDPVDLDALTSSPTTFSGKVSAGVGMGVGIEEWPNTEAANGKNWQELIRYSGFYDTTATLSVDARPEPYLRFYGSMETSLVEDEDAENAMRFEEPYLKEIFVDYTLMDTYFFRAGMQRLTWGQGRLLDNPGNLVSRISDGVAVRATAPLGRGTFNGVIYSKQQWVAGPYSSINPRVFAYAGQVETEIGAWVLALAGHFKMDDEQQEDFAGAAMVTSALGPFDLFVDLVGHWDREDPSLPASQWQAMGQIFWENDERSWSIVSEYQFDSSVADGMGHYLGCAVKFPKLFGSSWRPGIQWRHAFEDTSGEVVTGISGTIAPKLKLSLGLPVVYGSPGSYYRTALSESIENKDEEQLIPVDNVVSFLVTVSLSFSF